MNTHRDCTLFTMPPGLSFVEQLAKTLMEDPSLEGRWPGTALADYTVLVPTRRAARGLVEAFLQVGDGQALLLPVIRPLGDVDEDAWILEGTHNAQMVGREEDFSLPPAIHPLERQLILTRLILQWEKSAALHPQDAETGDPARAAGVAADLARFLDAVKTEQADWGALQTLVPDAYAANWQITLDFLKIVTAFWPDILRERGLLDPAERRNMLLSRQAAAWHDTPPSRPVLVAGSTGSIPAVAELMTTIARTPKGAVVLPGLDTALEERGWQAVGVSHPQYNMKRLLERMSVERDAVPVWPGAVVTQESHARAGLLREALRPAETTDSWASRLGNHANEADRALEGLSVLEAANPGEEATIIALMMRAALEKENQTAALVTPDRALARRVAGELGRWSVDSDDSAGLPFCETRVFVFLRLIMEAAEQAWSPVALLALLKHPLTRLGYAPGRAHHLARKLEQSILRGVRPAPGADGLRRALDAAGSEPEDVLCFIQRLEEAFAPVTAMMQEDSCSFGTLLEAHLAVGENLATGPEEGGGDSLWRGEEGEALASFFSALLEKAGEVEPLAPSRYLALVENLARGGVVRPRFGTHPRLFIRGVLEARLLQADLVILGGLNEGTWPGDAGVDPWLSRPMRQAMNLQPPERRIGLAAHDFAQGAAAPKVVLSRAFRKDGAPTVASRWLLRLESVARGLGRAGLPRAQPEWFAWAEDLDRSARYLSRPAPAPRPPVAARPDTFSVTEVETLIRDPYAIYARKILRLRPLDPLDAPVGAAERGTLVHRIMEIWVRAWPRSLPQDIGEALRKTGRQVFAQAPDNEAVRAFWWPRFEQIVEWMAAYEKERRPLLVQSWAECEGRLALSVPGVSRPLTLKARADRIDQQQDGSLAIVDYKTGSIPTKSQVSSGLCPQLPLEAVIAEAGHFEGVPAGPVASLRYLGLKGGPQGGQNLVMTQDGSGLGAQALEGFMALWARFEQEETPYLSRPRVQFASRFAPYDHLARVKEWSSSEGAEE